MRSLDLSALLASGCRQVVGGTVFTVAVICDCLALGSVCGALIRSSSCLAAGYNSNGVVKLVGGTVQQLLFFLKSDCEVTRSSSCLAAWCNWLSDHVVLQEHPRPRRCGSE